MTRDQYLRAPHVVPLSYSSSHRGVIDRHLASLRLTRNARVVVPFFSMAPHLLPGTDLIFTISRHFAEHYAAILPLVVVPCPIDYPRMRFYQIWHSRNQQSQAQRWLRGVLRHVAAQVLAPNVRQESGA
jgi:DNA-binding transcriptional LysR family regulator